MPDFAGDRNCVTHHACDCIQRKADAFDSLLEDLRAEMERLRGIADNPRVHNFYRDIADSSAQRLQQIVIERWPSPAEIKRAAERHQGGEDG